MLTTNQRGLVRTSVSSTEPITLADAKLYLRVDSTAEDALITNLMTVSREHAEHYLKRALVQQNWQLELDNYAPKRTHLPMGPVQSILSVVRSEADGADITLTASSYDLKLGRDILEFDSIPYASTVKISYQAGYSNAADVPASVRHGMLSHIAFLYECRGEHGGQSGELPGDVVSLYRPHREVRL